MKAVVNVSKVKVYVRDLEQGDLVYIWNDDLSPKLYEVSSTFDGVVQCIITFKQKERVLVGRKWWGLGQYEMQPMKRVWDPDEIVTVERHERIPV